MTVTLKQRFCQIAALLCLSLMLAAPAFADRQRLSVSTVEWDAPARTLGITHRIHVHDAEQALLREGLLEGPDLYRLENRARFALYVSRQFRLAGAEADIALESLGAEIEGNYIWVYQQAELTKAPDKLYVDCKILRDVFSDQSNHVNVIVSDDVQTLTFTKGDGIKSVP